MLLLLSQCLLVDTRNITGRRIHTQYSMHDLALQLTCYDLVLRSPWASNVDFEIRHRKIFQEIGISLRGNFD